MYNQMLSFTAPGEIPSPRHQPQPRPNPNTPLGRPKRQQEEVHKSTSPLNDRDNPSPKRVRIIPPSSYYPDPLPPIPNSLKTGCRMSQRFLPPINLRDCGVNTYVPTQKQHDHHRVYACTSCGSTESHAAVNPETHKGVLTEVQQAEIILATLRQQNLTIGQFFAIILDPENEDKLTQNSQSALAAFLQGRTKTGTQPIDAVQLMFHHRLSQDRLHETSTTYHPLPIYARPPAVPSFHPDIPATCATAGVMLVPGFDNINVWDGVRAHNSLKQYFLREVLDEINSEMKSLVKESTLRADGSIALTWAKMTTFSFTHTQELIQKRAPAMWSILTMAAVGNGNIGCLLSVQKEAQEGARGRGTNNMRDPWLGCTVTALILVYFRSVKANMMQTVIGNTLFKLFTTSAHRSVHAMLGRMGIATAYSSTIGRLHSLGLDKKATLKAIGCAVVAGKVQIHLLYDNINQYHRAWRANLTTQSALESGMAAMVIVNPDVDPKAFDGPGYYQRKAEATGKGELTFEKLKLDLDANQLEGTAIANILRILTKYIPELARFKRDVDDFQYKKHAKHRIKLEKTEYHPLECLGFNEAYTQGNRDVILEAFVRQLGVSRKELEGRQFPVSGDQSTIACIRTLLAQTSTCRTWFTSHKWVLPVIELWHMKWTFLKGIYKAHWASKVGKGDIGLRFAADRLGRKINPDKVDFYPGLRLAEVVLITMTLHFSRLHLLEELRTYCKPGFPLHKCGFSFLLQLARTIYTTYGTTEAATYAQHHNTSTAKGFFSVRVPNVPTPNPSSFPQSSPSDPDLDHGLSITSANDDDNDHNTDRLGNGAGAPLPSPASVLPQRRTDLNNASEDVQPAPSADNPEGDTLLYNNILLYRDLLHLYEFNTSVHDGDIGRTYEIIKWLRFYFFGVGSPNYGNELLHQFHERDLLQEHLNFWLKRVFNGQKNAFDSSFLWEAVSLNILDLPIFNIHCTNILLAATKQRFP
ncbi:uncharacterized protein EI90DRAFT_3014036 [Cantharellus anzutake]|uniref:uncharacterized protein n=1 Tax=Cantharellus anzutake TaxID=1750568 RepID=UPI0019081EF7|nr:uncharacterized protein EI90DRAFT_3014036 [Cantharellus anzutake]KAF8337097.1 hypothetical protein EI90DRAFT_3014036 [Cantharellus anzutake]